jgi:hypothetical protein
MWWMETARKCDSLVKAESETMQVLMERPRPSPACCGVREGGQWECGRGWVTLAGAGTFHKGTPREQHGRESNCFLLIFPM